jgi:hypothetical protein
VNSSEYKLGQGVLQDYLQILLYDLKDMHRPSHNIEEVIEFQKDLNDKKI